MGGMIEALLNNRRSLKQALADLLAAYQREPSPGLARRIEIIRYEIELRKTAQSSLTDGCWKIAPVEPRLISSQGS